MSTHSASSKPPRLVLRFAAYSAIALLLAGLGILWFVRHETQLQEERFMSEHAALVARSVSDELTPLDLAKPVRGGRLVALDKAFAGELRTGVVRVKLWSPDGTLTYSNEHSLIGSRSPEPEELAGVLNGRPHLEVTRLLSEHPRDEDTKVLEALVPVRLAGDQEPAGALEISHDYSPVAEQIWSVVKPVAIALGLALLLLYAALFPILRQITRALELRNRRLSEQSNALRKTLTQREQTEKRLREAEASYRALVEQLPLVTYVDRLDETSSTVYKSPQVEPLLGYPLDEWIADPALFHKILHPDDRERVIAEHADAYARGQSFSTEYRLLARNGRVVWVHDEVMIMRDADGRPTHTQGFLLDITERKEAENALHESEERFRTLVSNVPGVIFRCEIDADWTMEYISEAVEDLSGYPASDFVGNRVRTFASVIHPEDAERVEREIHAAVEAEHAYAIEYRVVARNGGVRWVLERGQAVVGADDVLMLDGALFDVTERRESEDERLKLAAIVESSDDAIISADLAGRIVSWNEGAENVYGYSADEILHRPISILAPPERVDEPMSFLEAIKEGRGLAHHEAVRVRKDGTRIDVSLTISPIRDSSGNIIGASAITRDITERKQAERERERLLALEREQNERLRELDKLKDEFIALVSHELRTPLTSIRGYLELVLDGEAGDLTDEQRQFLSVVERNAHRLLALVGDLLFLAQVEAGKLSLEVGAVDLAAIAAESVEAARPLAEEKGITLTLASGPLPLLAGDRARLAQLLDNVVSNGLKFTPEGGRVDVRVRAVRGSAVVEVRDTGIGIPAVEQERLFERFFRSSNAAERQIQGTGLGLAISKAIVEAHGGRISVTSEENVGTTFKISVPIRQPQVAELEPAQAIL